MRFAARLSLRTSVAVIHGGLDRVGRGDAIRRFTRGDARILVATDAAAEGLNLQARCRFVIHLDLPWAPTTLAQRVGRVDRIGQSRQVRVWHLAGAGGHEEAVVSALAKRLRRIHREIGGPFPGEWARLPEDSSTQLGTDAEVHETTREISRRTRNASHAPHTCFAACKRKFLHRCTR
jgi:superfamily II DNA/RNA helicase